MIDFKKNIIKEEKRLKREWKNIIFNACFAFLSLAFSILFYKNVILASTLIAIVSIVGLIKWKSWTTLAIFIFAAILGPLSEIWAVHFNVWSYSLANFFNIPFWLFILWGNAACFIYQTAKEFHRLGVKS